MHVIATAHVTSAQLFLNPQHDQYPAHPHLKGALYVDVLDVAKPWRDG